MNFVFNRIKNLEETMDAHDFSEGEFSLGEDNFEEMERENYFK